MKICTMCKVEKPLDEFGKQKTTKPDGTVYYRPTSRCLSCRRVKYKEWTEENSEKYQEIWKEKNKKKYAETKSDFFKLKAEQVNGRARRAKLYERVTKEEMETLGHPETCYLCGGKFEDNGFRTRKPELDHITPLSRGGKNEIGNLAWIHGYCNRYFKNHLTLEQMLAFFKRIEDNLKDRI